MVKKSSKQISAGKGLWTGLFLLGQVTAILILTAVAGYVLDLVFETAPLALAGSVVVGGIGATLVVLKEVTKLSE
jgi:F0F1-type ATP synthase assembly protein I